MLYILPINSIKMSHENAMGNWWRIVAPRPVVLLTSVGGDGKANVMALAWSTPVSHNPPLIAVAVHKARHSHKLMEETGDFVLNIPTREMADAVQACGTMSGEELDKFVRTGLKTGKAKRVKAPIVEGCIAYIECKVVNKILTGDHTLFIGGVLAAYAKGGLFTRQGWNLEKVKPLLHSGGKFYSEPSMPIVAK
jgi:flavin reductase (DIM6/NTAB) family NADH-FMN oxidoreductase RutF